MIIKSLQQESGRSLTIVAQRETDVERPVVPESYVDGDLTYHGEMATTTEDAWKQVVAGIDAMKWSNLASWNSVTAQLEAATNEHAFDEHWTKIDPRSGRWLCWMAFSVGAESFTRGAFALRNHEIRKFGACHPWHLLNMPSAHRAAVKAAIHKLATHVRNRDAHRYMPQVRSADFPLINSEFVPALNRILETLDCTEISCRYASHP